MLKHGILLSTVFFLCAALFAAEEGKSAALNRMREAKAGTLMRGHWLAKQDWKKCLELLEPDGSFKDMKEFEREIRAKELTRKEFSYTEPQSRIVAMTSKAFQRLWAISEALRKDEIPADRGTEVKRALYRAIERYGDIEVNRISTHSGRWHASCFFIPTAAVNLYFANFSDMKEAENGTCRDSDTLKANAMLKKLAFQAWSQPMRNDATDQNIISPERFRNSTFYVGGNALEIGRAHV